MDSIRMIRMDSRRNMCVVLEVPPSGNVRAYIEKPEMSDTFTRDACWRINREECSLDEAMEILASEGFEPEFSDDERSVL